MPCPNGRDLTRPAEAPAISQRRRWWQHARRRLAWAAAHPLRVREESDFRSIEVMGAYGIRIECATGLLTGVLLTRHAGRLQRHRLADPNISLVGSPATVGLLEHIVRRDAQRWANQAGATSLDPDALRKLGQRLCRGLWARWSRDGTLQRLRQQVAEAFGLDPETVRLAQLVARRRGGAAHADEGDYNRAIVDRAHLVVLEREAPHLIPLFAELFTTGACVGEPKRALRTAYLDQIGAPRHWRQLVALPPQTLAWARHAPRQPQVGAMVDLALMLTILNTPATPPLDWLQAQLDSAGGGNLLLGMSHCTRVAALRAHLFAWLNSDAAGKDQLLVEMQIVEDWIDSQAPNVGEAAKALCHWSWWTRRALAWDRTRRQSAIDVPAVQPAPLPLFKTLAAVELRPLLTALDLHDEARTMAHCVDRWRDGVAQGAAAAWSVRDRHTGHRLATAGIARSTQWQVQVRGFANRAVPAALETLLASALDGERQRLQDLADQAESDLA